MRLILAGCEVVATQKLCSLSTPPVTLGEKFYHVAKLTHLGAAVLDAPERFQQVRRKVSPKWYWFESLFYL